MANSNKVIGAIAAAAGAATAMAKAVEKMADVIPDKSDNGPQVIIPALYDRDFPLKLNDAVELLTSYGLKVITSELYIRDADIKYRDCFDTQVIDSKPKHQQKVRVGSTVILRYITQDVIDESRKIFDEVESLKAKAKQKREEQLLQTREQIQRTVLSTADRAKGKISGMFAHQKREPLETLPEEELE